MADIGAKESRQDHRKDLLDRLSRIDGQVRGVARMIEDGRYCIDVLTQISAIRAALAKVESRMLKAHLDSCVEAAITGGDPDAQRRQAAELIALLERSNR
jgi:DNA-binding FrmR family transcriptional regulator